MIDNKIAIIGLGYVGLPLAVAFSEKYKVVGLDSKNKRVEELNLGYDSTLEIDQATLKSVLHPNYENNTGLIITDSPEGIKDCNIYIITVPTPIDNLNKPVLTPMIKATETVAHFLKKEDIVIYESTVYPGVTEDVMVPILERLSGLSYNVDFFCGYSPERINPGDKKHTVTKIIKVTSGSNPETATIVDDLYKSIITAGTFKAANIKVAEAAKVIENAQRDINIAFINELSKIFNLIDIDTNDVLEAAGTKWNFIKFNPGLVGGHCIGVDPYYLAQKAQEVGYYPEIILAGRRMNDGMGTYVANQTIQLMISNDIRINGANVLILGFTFKENCPDVRNTKVVDLINELLNYPLNVTIYDPWASPDEVQFEYGIKTLKEADSLLNLSYDAIILAVAHDHFLTLDFNTLIGDNTVIYDIKGFLPRNLVHKRL